MFFIRVQMLLVDTLRRYSQLPCIDSHQLSSSGKKLNVRSNSVRVSSREIMYFSLVIPSLMSSIRLSTHAGVSLTPSQLSGRSLGSIIQRRNSTSAPSRGDVPFHFLGYASSSFQIFLKMVSVSLK